MKYVQIIVINVEKGHLRIESFDTPLYLAHYLMI